LQCAPSKQVELEVDAMMMRICCKTALGDIDNLYAFVTGLLRVGNGFPSDPETITRFIYWFETSAAKFQLEDVSVTAMDVESRCRPTH
jgi:hypothetical protein